MATTRRKVSGESGFDAVRKDDFTGAASIDTSSTIDKPTQLVSVSCKFSAAPTTSEDFTITANLAAGSTYDVLLYSVDPSASSLTDLVWLPDAPMWFYRGDAIDVAYTNTDTKTYSVQVTLKEAV